MHSREIGEAPGRKGAQQVERRDALVVGAEESFGVGAARLGVELFGVDDVPAKGLEALAVVLLVLLGAGLGELARDAPHFDHRHAGRVGQRHGHLQDDL